MSRVILVVVARDLDDAKNDLGHFVSEPKVGKDWTGLNQFGFYDYDYGDWSERETKEMFDEHGVLEAWGVVYQGVPYFSEIWPNLGGEIRYAEDGAAIWGRNEDWDDTCEHIRRALTNADKLFSVTVHL